jgi:bifunctional oligoribonuclease and PAP phosphatase NrnA
VTGSPGSPGPMHAAVEAIRSARQLTAICHENPDADTIGAAVAIAHLARRLGKEAEVVAVDALAETYAYLGEPTVHRAPTLGPDLAVVCDAATLDRVGRVVVEHEGWFAQSRILNIDHHVTNTAFGQINLVDSTAAATCQVVHALVRALGVELDAPIATALLTGIVRDSQGFADESTSPRTLRIVAELMEAGGSLADVHRRILGELPFPTIALWGRVMATATARRGGRVVTAVLTPDMLDATGTEQHDADGVVEFLARSQGAEVILLLRELGPSETRISVRTAGDVDATAIAGAFGGGGHVRRAGCTIRVPLAEAVERADDAAAAVLDGLPSAALGSLA